LNESWNGDPRVLLALAPPLVSAGSQISSGFIDHPAFDAQSRNISKRFHGILDTAQKVEMPPSPPSSKDSSTHDQNEFADMIGDQLEMNERLNSLLDEIRNLANPKSQQIQATTQSAMIVPE